MPNAHNQRTEENGYTSDGSVELRISLNNRRASDRPEESDVHLSSNTDTPNNTQDITDETLEASDNPYQLLESLLDAQTYPQSIQYIKDRIIKLLRKGNTFKYNRPEQLWRIIQFFNAMARQTGEPEKPPVRAVLEMAPGIGKTNIFLLIIILMNSATKGNHTENQKAMIVVPKNNLGTQASSRYQEICKQYAKFLNLKPLKMRVRSECRNMNSQEDFDILIITNALLALDAKGGTQPRRNKWDLLKEHLMHLSEHFPGQVMMDEAISTVDIQNAFQHIAQIEQPQETNLIFMLLRNLNLNNTHYPHIEALCRTLGIETNLTSLQSQTSVYGPNLPPLQSKNLLNNNLSLVVFDEAHNALQEDAYQHISSLAEKAMVLAVSATARFQCGDKTCYEILGLSPATNPLSSYTITKAIDNGKLAPILVTDIAVYKASTIRCAMQAGDYKQTSLQAIINTFEHNRIVCDVLAHRTDKQGRPFSTRKGIIHCCGIQHANDLAEILNGCETLKRGHSGIVAKAIHSENKLKHKQIYQDFKSGKIQYLLGAEMLVEGFDEQSVNLVVDLHPTKLVGRMLQKLGRGLRTHKEKPYCDMLVLNCHLKGKSHPSDILGGMSRGIALEVVDRNTNATGDNTVDMHLDEEGDGEALNPSNDLTDRANDIRSKYELMYEMPDILIEAKSIKAKITNIQQAENVSKETQETIEYLLRLLTELLSELHESITPLKNRIKRTKTIQTPTIDSTEDVFFTAQASSDKAASADEVCITQPLDADYQAHYESRVDDIEKIFSRIKANCYTGMSSESFETENSGPVRKKQKKSHPAKKSLPTRIQEMITGFQGIKRQYSMATQNNTHHAGSASFSDQSQTILGGLDAFLDAVMEITELVRSNNGATRNVAETPETPTQTDSNQKPTNEIPAKISDIEEEYAKLVNCYNDDAEKILLYFQCASLCEQIITLPTLNTAYMMIGANASDTFSLKNVCGAWEMTRGYLNLKNKEHLKHAVEFTIHLSLALLIEADHKAFLIACCHKLEDDPTALPYHIYTYNLYCLGRSSTFKAALSAWLCEFSTKDLSTLINNIINYHRNDEHKQGALNQFFDDLLEVLVEPGKFISILNAIEALDQQQFNCESTSFISTFIQNLLNKLMYSYAPSVQIKDKIPEALGALIDIKQKYHAPIKPQNNVAFQIGIIVGQYDVLLTCLKGSAIILSNNTTHTINAMCKNILRLPDLAIAYRLIASPNDTFPKEDVFNACAMVAMKLVENSCDKNNHAVAFITHLSLTFLTPQDHQDFLTKWHVYASADRIPLDAYHLFSCDLYLANNQSALNRVLELYLDKFHFTDDKYKNDCLTRLIKFVVTTNKVSKMHTVRFDQFFECLSGIAHSDAIYSTKLSLLLNALLSPQESLNGIAIERIRKLKNALGSNANNTSKNNSAFFAMAAQINTSNAYLPGSTNASSQLRK